MLDDIRVSQGVLVTTKGYSKAAWERAHRDPRDIILQILPPDRLSDYQFIGCLLCWKGPVLAMVEPPDGWVVDFENTAGPFQFSMYPLGHSRESAMKMCPFIYGNIVLKTAAEPNMDAIAKRHEQDILKSVPNAVFHRLENEHSVQSILRVGEIAPSYGGPEYSLYRDTLKGTLVLVLICPRGQEAVYLPALKWIGFGAIVWDRKDEGNEPLSPAEQRVVGCTVFPSGARRKLIESGEHELKVVE
jgi:hypothetical protein